MGGDSEPEAGNGDYDRYRVRRASLPAARGSHESALELTKEPNGTGCRDDEGAEAIALRDWR
jgi:hypothetical protein